MGDTATTAIAPAARAAEWRKLDAWGDAVRRRGGFEHWRLCQITRGTLSQVTRGLAEEFIGQRVYEAAQVDANDSSPDRVASYAIVALSAEREEVERFTFRVVGRPQNTSAAGPEEDASPTGLVAQAMRHTEAIMRARLGMVFDATDVYRELLRDRESEVKYLRERVQNLEKKLDETADERERLRAASAEQERATTREKASNARMDKLFATLSAIGPAVILRMVGATKGLDPEVQAFVLSLRPEQLPALVQCLDAGQQLALTELVKRYVPDAPGENQKKKEG